MLAAGPVEPGPAGPLEIASSRMGHLLDALSRAYDALGFPQAAGHDEVFRQLVPARMARPARAKSSAAHWHGAAVPASAGAPATRA